MPAGVTSAPGDAPPLVLRACYDAALAAVEPVAAMRRALGDDGPKHPAWIISVGKAAVGTAQGLVEWLAAGQRAVAGGLIVSRAPCEHAPGNLLALAGDHPVPGTRSQAAADALSRLTGSIPAGAEVHIVISGGTSALLAGPLAGLTQHDVTDTFALLLDSGLDIHQSNAVRKRITQWSAGRLALALTDRALFVWLISDVPGDDIATIGSGPCTGDAWTAQRVRELVRDHDLDRRLSAAVRQALTIETPKPDDARLASVKPTIVASIRTALEGAAARARAFGLTATVMDQRLAGPAATMGRTVADRLRATAPGTLLIWGGETTVALDANQGRGGRSQELALAAAERLRDLDGNRAVLAAGTDGRDGPTDAAGAIVDGTTWQRIAAAGHDPADALARHNAYPALAAVDRLVRTGDTGTNVSDLVLALNARPRAAP
jgi:hydroxypyruvate reductase